MNNFHISFFKKTIQYTTRIVCLILFFFLYSICFSQKKDNILEDLTEQIISNPDNPLRIDQNFLIALSKQIKSPQLKSILNSYSENIKLDQDLSFRQVYYDIASSFKQNPELLIDNSFNQAAKKLDLLFNNYASLSDKLKSLKTNKYEFGMFINDPKLISGLSGIAGSYESALSLGLGVEFILSVSDIIAENKKFKEDYKKLANISKKVIYSEKDNNLTKALVDASLLISCNDGPSSGNLLTPIYRYDFSNGNSLLVEKGVLKFLHSNGSSKLLLKIQKKHDGNFYAFTDITLPIILISDDEKYFYINNVQINETIADKNGEYLKNGGYIFNTENCELLLKSTRSSRPISGATPYIFDNFKFVEYYVGGDGSILCGWNLESSKFKDIITFHSNSNLRTFFKNSPYYVEKVIEKNSIISYLRFENPYNEAFNSEFIIANANKSGYTNSDGLHNEITGFTNDKYGNVYFVSSSGAIGKIANSDYIFDNSLTTKIRRALNSGRLVSPYDFVNDKVSFISLHGGNSAVKHDIPRLKITSDNKYLVYLVKDSLYVINPDNFNEIKRFGLSVRSHNFYFSKENSSWILNILGTNDYKFPIHKKYSLDKLSLLNTNPITKVQSNTENSTSQLSQNTNTSIVKELKELNELKQQGIINQQEFDAAKSKLLGTTKDNNQFAGANTTNSKNIKNNPPKKENKEYDILKYSIAGVDYCAVKAPANSEFIGKYSYNGTEPCFGQNGVSYNKKGDPIIQLDLAESITPEGIMARNGIWQAHCAQPIEIWWWLETDCTETIKFEKGARGDRYILVMRYKNGDKTYKSGSYSRVTLDKWLDGSNKIVILGERIKNAN